MKKVSMYLFMTVLVAIAIAILPAAMDGSQSFHDGFMPSAQERQMVANRLSAY